MKTTNTRATIIMHEIQQGNYIHMAELREACDKQLSLVIYRKGYGFFADWDEEDGLQQSVIKN